MPRNGGYTVTCYPSSMLWQYIARLRCEIKVAADRELPLRRQRFGVELVLGSPVTTLVVQPANASTPVGQLKVRFRFPWGPVQGEQPQCVFWMFSSR